jgi:hypothetical protein
MPKKPIPFRSLTSSESKSIFFRERLILNVANLRYELDVISIRTPLPPVSRAQVAPAAPSKAVQKEPRPVDD